MTSLPRPCPRARPCPCSSPPRGWGSSSPGWSSRPARRATEWRFFSFARGLLTAPDTAGWDLGMRRYHLIVAGTAAEIDTGSFETLTATPTAAYESTSYGRDTVNRAIARWYRYDMFSHLLHPKRAVYVVKNRDGSAYELEFVGAAVSVFNDV